MANRKKAYSKHITAAKDWLGRAEESIAENNDIRSDLDLMLAQAEIQRAKEKNDIGLFRKWLKWTVPWMAAAFVAAAYICFLRPVSSVEKPPAVQTEAGINISVSEEADYQKNKTLEPVKEIQNSSDEISIYDEAKAVEKDIEKTRESTLSAGNISESAAEQEPIKKETVSEEKSVLPPEDIQKMIQSAGRVLREEK